METRRFYFAEPPKSPATLFSEFSEGKFVSFTIKGRETILKKLGPGTVAIIPIEKTAKNFKESIQEESESISFFLWGAEDASVIVEPFGKSSFILRRLR